MSVNVVHIHRRPFAGQFSVENLFTSLRTEMQRAGWQVDQLVVPHFSKGLLRRMLNGWSAFKGRGVVNHVTGDIHYIAMFLPRNRTILTIHDCHALERLTGIRRWVLKLLWFELPVRHVRFVTVISQETKLQLLRHVSVPEDKIRVISNVISPIFQPSPKSFNSGCPRILQIGTKENKNLSRLAQALAGVRCHLRVIGVLNSTQSKELRQASIDFSSVSNLSELEIYREYCQADLVSFVSTYEGFGMPILEANAVGRPVVASNTSSMPEVAGSAACLIDPFDIQAIRAGLLRVINEYAYREQLVALGYQNVPRFSAGAIVGQYLSLYEQVLKPICLNGYSALASEETDRTAQKCSTFERPLCRVELDA